MLEIRDPSEDGHALTLAGELDLATTPLLLERASPLLEGGGDLTLVLSDVSFIDSQGIRGFIQIARALEGRGRLVLARPSPEVRKLLGIVRLHDLPNVVVDG